MKKINILHLTYTLFPYGGVGNYLLNLSQNLDNRKFNLYICCIGEKGGFEKEISKNVVKLFFLNRKINIDIFTLIDILKIVNKYKIDIVHTHLARSGIYGRLAGILSHRKIIVNEHGLRRNSSIIVKWLENHLNVFTDVLICNSKATLNKVKENIKTLPEKTEVLYLGVNDFDRDKEKTLRRKLNFSDREIIIVNIGGLIDWRDHKTILNAAKILKEKNIKCHFVIIGDGPLKYELYSLQKIYSLDNVHFMGYIENAKFYLSNFDIYINSALEEGFGIATVEAMLSSLPVIVANAGALPELIEDTKSGLIFEPQNPQSLAEKIEYLVKNPFIMKTLGSNARQRALKFFSNKIHFEKLADLYKSIICEKKE